VVTALHVLPSKQASNIIVGWLFKKKENYFSAPLTAVRRSAKALGMKVDTIAFISDQEEVGEEICNLAKIRDANLIMLGTGYSEKFYNNVGVASFVLENANQADVGIVIPRGDVSKPIRKILAPVLRDANPASLKYVAQMAKFEALSITLLHLVEPGAIRSPDVLNNLTQLCTENSTMKFVSVITKHPFDDIKKELNTNEYSLLLMDHVDKEARKLYRHCPCTLLVICTSSSRFSEGSSDPSSADEEEEELDELDNGENSEQSNSKMLSHSEFGSYTFSD
jgi:hypothetical protein